MWTAIPARLEVPACGNCAGGSYWRLVTIGRGQRRGGVTFRPCRWPSWGLELEAVLVAHGVGFGAAGVGLVREAGGGGLGA